MDRPTRPLAPLRVLVVDPDPRTAEVLGLCPTLRRALVAAAGSVGQARARLVSHPVDLLLFDPHLPDASGFRLARELSPHRGLTQIIALLREPSPGLTIEAMRAGVQDVLLKPLAPAETDERLRLAVERLRRSQRSRHRLRKLRRLCRDLDHARQDIAHQVDVLCNDLVTAYQELASQMHLAVHTTEFNAVVKQELDLEQFIRKALEYLLDKAGPTNAAIYLPNGGDEYALGGYINYDYGNASPDFLLEQIGDSLAARLGQAQGVVHLRDPGALEEWVGPAARALDESHLLALPCRHEGENLAVLVLFRHRSQPFSPDLIETISAVAGTMAHGLARIIRVHHRRLGDPDDTCEAA